MKLTRRQESALYIAVVASVHGAITNKGRTRPLIAARIAHERALAAVHVANGKRKHG